MMDVLIVDDEHLARQRLSRLVNDLGYSVIAEAANAELALAAVKEFDPSILLLDIEMPGENGMQLAEAIAELDTPPAIVFTTAYDHYAIDAFNTLAAGYLLKPVQKNQLQKVLDKAKSLSKLQLLMLGNSENLSSSGRRNQIAAKTHRGMDIIPLENIACFIADHKYVMVVSHDKRVLIDETLKELEQEFSETFCRVHRNALVSKKHIQGIERDNQGHYFVRLAQVDEKPMVSRRYTSKIKALLKKL
ncbi:MAG: LytTR family DNA-binding domain-containing protein [Pseudomonadota bacterium]